MFFLYLTLALSHLLYAIQVRALLIPSQPLSHNNVERNLLPRASIINCSPSDVLAITDIFRQVVQIAYAGELASTAAEWNLPNEDTLRRHVMQQDIAAETHHADLSWARIAAHMITSHVRFAVQFNFSPGPDTQLARRYFRDIQCEDWGRRCERDPEAIAYKPVSNMIVLCRDRFFALDPLTGSNSVRDRVSAVFAMFHSVGQVDQVSPFYHVPQLSDPIAPYILFSKEMLRRRAESRLGLRFDDK